MIKILKILILMTGMLFFKVCGYCKESKTENFEIRHADSLLADKQQINIMGNIVINYKDAVIEAPEGNVETNSEGKPEKAIFIGRAKLKLKDRKIEADKITVSILNKVIYAEGNTTSELNDKKNIPIIIMSDYQELLWSGENANAKGNLKASYEDTKIKSDEAKIIYKNKRPKEAIFESNTQETTFEQPTSITYAKEIGFDINTHNIHAVGSVKSTIWTDEKKPKSEQDAIYLNGEDVLLEQDTGTITAKSDATTNKVTIGYQETKGESNEGFLLRDKDTKKPEKIIFKGNANVSQSDKQLTSEEIVFNFKDKRLTSNTKTNIRPKTLIFKKE